MRAPPIPRRRGARARSPRPLHARAGVTAEWLGLNGRGAVSVKCGWWRSSWS